MPKSKKQTLKTVVLGQYFTKKNVVKRVINLLLEYKSYDKIIKILEPSFGTGNFIEILKENNFNNIDGCEIDSEFTTNPCDFFELPLTKKYDLIIGNPPFTKYNIKESYYYPKKYFEKMVHPENYLNKKLIKKEKIQIENVFLLKSINHLINEKSTIGFVLPISFFIKNKNKEIKKELAKKFSTIIIYQNSGVWFDTNIPCCFAIFTNISNLKNKIILLYEDGGNVKEILDIDELNNELIPKSFLYKKNHTQEGTPISGFLSENKVKYRKSYDNNTVSGANILKKTSIPQNKNISDYYLAIVRVGNASVGKAGFINIKEDILNDMFYVFKFKEELDNDKDLKEKICSSINKSQEHFKNLTFRVGSKSIKKEDIFNFKVKI